MFFLLQSNGAKPVTNVGPGALVTANVPVANTGAGQPTTGASSGAALPGTAVPDEGAAHVADGTLTTYKSYPPSSGPHYGTTTPYGFSDKEIPEGNLVHDLEHGALVLYYKPDLPANVVQQLRDAFTKLPPAKYGKVKLVITPYSKIQSSAIMVLAGWNRVVPFTEYNFDKLSAAYQAIVDKGPEDIP